jgi:hypothetical protein
LPPASSPPGENIKYYFCSRNNPALQPLLKIADLCRLQPVMVEYRQSCIMLLNAIAQAGDTTRADKQSGINFTALEKEPGGHNTAGSGYQ